MIKPIINWFVNTKRSFQKYYGIFRADRLYRLGRYDDALRLNEWAYTICEAQDDIIYMARCDQKEGEICSSLGQYDKALTLLELSRDTFSKHNSTYYLAISDIILSLLFSKLELYEEAFWLTNSALEVLRNL